MKPSASIYGLRRQHVLIFVSGVLMGIFSSHLLDMPKMTTNRILKQIKVINDIGDPQSFVNEHEGGHHAGEDVIANELAKKVRVYALILTMPASKHTKALHVKATWARRFNGYTFISSEDDKDLPSVRAVPKEGREALWEKTRYAMLYAYKKHLNDFDFFMKADDDTYVIVENLRYLLLNHDPDQPILMGRRFAVCLNTTSCLFSTVLLICY
uniref:N-acetylgalactosaminide beta-1,3-galactosyltransferase n=1 Tax=Mesocestoides corti TaxID=53468 RepID=A0A5K3FUQ3_MESCO